MIKALIGIGAAVFMTGTAVAKPSGRSPGHHPAGQTLAHRPRPKPGPSATSGTRKGRATTRLRRGPGPGGLPYAGYYGAALPNGDYESGAPLLRAPEAIEPPPPVAYAEPSSIQPPHTGLPPRNVASKTGSLRLEVGWSAAQVYVDGFYAGTVDECNRTPAGVILAAGWHRLELRAPGFQTLAANVTIAPEQVVVYHGDLRPLGL